MLQDEMVKFWGYSKRTVNDYLEQLENMQLIYVYRHNKRRTDGTYYKLNNSYGRYADRDMIIAEAQKYAGTVEWEDEFKKLDRRSIKMRYNVYLNGSKKYIDAPVALLELYRECLLYNKSLKLKTDDFEVAIGFRKGILGYGHWNTQIIHAIPVTVLPNSISEYTSCPCKILYVLQNI